jgi:uncharacterized repeat protein (TIGR02543 family)
MKNTVVFGLLVILLTFGFLGCENGNDNGNDEFTVTFDSNGGSDVAKITGILSGSIITLPENPTKAHNYFSGWFIDNNTFLNEFTALTPITQSITVYAKWSQNTYEVTFDSNGGSTVWEITGIMPGSTIELPSEPTKDAHTFVGWFIDNNTFLNEFTALTPISQNITVYAKWSQNTYEVTFDSNGGSTVWEITGITPGSTIELPSEPTKNAHAFAGWFIDNNTFLNEFTESTPVTGNITVFAKWVFNWEGKSVKITNLNSKFGFAYVVLLNNKTDYYSSGVAINNDNNAIINNSVIIPLYDTENWSDTPWTGSGSYHVYITLAPPTERYVSKEKINFDTLQTEFQFNNEDFETYQY